MNPNFPPNTYYGTRLLRQQLRIDIRTELTGRVLGDLERYASLPASVDQRLEHELTLARAVVRVDVLAVHRPVERGDLHGVVRRADEIEPGLKGAAMNDRVVGVGEVERYRLDEGDVAVVHAGELALVAQECAVQAALFRRVVEERQQHHQHDQHQDEGDGDAARPAPLLRAPSV